MFNEPHSSSSESSYEGLSPHPEQHQDFIPYQHPDSESSTSPNHHPQDTLSSLDDSDLGSDSQPPEDQNPQGLPPERDPTTQQKPYIKKEGEGGPDAVFPPLSATTSHCLTVQTNNEGKIIFEPDHVLKSFTGVEIDAYVLRCRTLQRKSRHRRKTHHLPLAMTKEEELHLKAIQKKVHNREYALLHRRRKKEQAEQMRAELDLANSQIRSLTETVQEYKDQIAKLQQENDLLRQRCSGFRDMELKQPQVFVCPPQKKQVCDGLVQDNGSVVQKDLCLDVVDNDHSSSTEPDEEDFQVGKDTVPPNHQETILPPCE